jgi:acetyl-CoA acyltransferase
MTKQIQDAYIVAAVRTPIGKAPRGMFRNVRPDDMLAHVLKGAMAQVPGLDPHDIGDVVVGCAMPEGEQGMNVARIGVLLARRHHQPFLSFRRAGHLHGRRPHPHR